MAKKNKHTHTHTHIHTHTHKHTKQERKKKYNKQNSHGCISPGDILILLQPVWYDNHRQMHIQISKTNSDDKNHLTVDNMFKYENNNNNNQNNNNNNNNNNNKMGVQSQKPDIIRIPSKSPSPHSKQDLFINNSKSPSRATTTISFKSKRRKSSSTQPSLTHVPLLEFTESDFRQFAEIQVLAGAAKFVKKLPEIKQVYDDPKKSLPRFYVKLKNFNRDAALLKAVVCAPFSFFSFFFFSFLFVFDFFLGCMCFIFKRGHSG